MGLANLCCLPLCAQAVSGGALVEAALSGITTEDGAKEVGVDAAAVTPLAGQVGKAGDGARACCGTKAQAKMSRAASVNVTPPRSPSPARL